MNVRVEEVARLRALFPALAEGALAPLDNAATTHRPQAVLDAANRFYKESNANVHRANHRLGMAATGAYEAARRRVARFLDSEAEEVVFTRNATDAINLVARGWLESRLGADDVVVVTALEHHSNLVPWQQVCRRTGARLAVLQVDEFGRLQEPFEFPERACFLATTRVSNALGTIVDTAALVEQAQSRGMAVLVDATQAAGHLPLDAGSRAADFLALSAHKMYGPMGVGVLRGRAQRLSEMEPVSYGGEMVDGVSQQSANWREPPWRFEAGTPAVAPVVAFPPALDLLDSVGLASVRAHELELLGLLLEGLKGIEGLSVVGPPGAEDRSGAVSMAIPGGDPHVAATLLDLSGVAVRAGWHCAEPLLRGMGQGPTLRASVALYSSAEDVERLLEALPETVLACRDPAPNL